MTHATYHNGQQSAETRKRIQQTLSTMYHIPS